MASTCWCPTVTGLGCSSLLVVARVLLNRARDFEYNLMLYESGEAGHLRIGVAPLLANAIFPALAANILRERPGIRMNVDIRAADQLIEEIREDVIDLIFATSFDMQNVADLVSRDLFDLNLLVVARRDHPLAHQGHVTLDDIWKYTVSCDTSIVVPSNDARLFVCNHQNILRNVVLKTDLVWMTALEMVKDDIAIGLFRRVLSLAPYGITGRAVVAHRKFRTLSPAAQHLVRESINMFI
jgi:DNA-binding transcriptional LysR family regulator